MQHDTLIRRALGHTNCAVSVVAPPPMNAPLPIYDAPIVIDGLMVPEAHIIAACGVLS